MPQNKQNHKSAIEARFTSLAQYSGPLPAPEDLRKYNEIVPDAAERILRMAEAEMNFRHDTTRRGQRARIRLSFLSSVLAFISVLVLSAVIAYAIYRGHFSTAVGIAFGAIASVAGIFVYSRSKNNSK